jgi:nicotinamide-nucleotide amidase
LRAELVTIGTELLLGFTIDTNGAFIAERLAEIGVRLARRASVGDDPDAIREAVSEALARSGFVITTGGLGPTRDDLTKRVIADLFQAPLEFHPNLWDALVERFARFGRVPSESNRSQAEVPRGAVVLPNRRGTAPGLWLSGSRGEVIMLPGVPGEMRGLIVEEVVPRLATRVVGGPIRSLTVRTTGLPESTLADRIRGIEDALAPLTLAYLPGTPGVDLRLTAWGVDAAEAGVLLDRARRRLAEELGDHCYGTGDDDLAAVLLRELQARDERLAVAESCTGGLLGQRITAVPGSSAVFVGGVTAYANEVKRTLLGVPEDVLAREGAVSEATALAMAEGVCRALGATVAASITGVAGPDGGSAAKPVGTIWMAFGVRGAFDARHVVLPGTREDIRARAAQAALHGLWRRVRQAEGSRAFTTPTSS